MKYLPLIWAGLWRKRARTLLTLLSVVTAFVLYGLLSGVTASFGSVLDRFADASRLRVQNRVNITGAVPMAYMPRIETVAGVRGVAPLNVLIGYYQEPTNGIGGIAIDMDKLSILSGDFIVPEDQLEAMGQNRSGAIVGSELLEKYDWKIGDRVTLKSPVWTRPDGSDAWVFDIVGTYSLREGSFPENDDFFINSDYFDEGRAFGNGTVAMYLVRIDDPGRGTQIAQEIDSLFRNSPYETLTQTDRDFIRSQIDRIGDINFIVNAIVGAVMFTLLFLTGNTMMQSIRERIPELAVLKTYGFSSTAITALVVGESLLLCLTAAGIGLAIAAATFPMAFDSMGVAPLPLEWTVVATGAGVAALLALVSALPPVWRVQRLKIVDALAGR
jgi:putative ABC transport system permease protein